MRDKTLFIFGDSFSIGPKTINTKIAWPERLELSEDYGVWNFSALGNSNHNIFLDFVRHIEHYRPEDAILICWSDWVRPFINGERNQQDAFRAYNDYFYNIDLAKYHSKLYLDEIQRLEKERNLRLLFAWAFPTDYTYMKNWISDGFSPTIKQDTYVYSHEFTNEIRPTLMHFSRLEYHDICKTEAEIAATLAADTRPNHVANRRYHEAMFRTVDGFVRGKVSGKIDLTKLGL